MFEKTVDKDIILRLLEDRHASEFYLLVQKNGARLLKWCPWLDQVSTVELTGDFICGRLQRFADGNGFTAGIFKGNVLVGVIALEYIDHANRMTEIGYWVDRDIEGKGLVTKACMFLIDYVFCELKMNRVQIRCAEQNFRSRAIPMKLGFREEGTIRSCERLSDRYVDLVVFGMLANEWNSVKK